jgi:hypothetical protein
MVQLAWTVIKQMGIFQIKRISLAGIKRSGPILQWQKRKMATN